MSLKQITRLRLIVHLVLFLVLFITVVQVHAEPVQVMEEQKPTPRLIMERLETERRFKYQHWTPEVSRNYARTKISKYGWGEQQFECLVELWDRESNWNYLADNPTSSAFGIPQMLKLDPTTPPDKQIELGLKYIDKRHLSPCGALSFHNKKNWY